MKVHIVGFFDAKKDILLKVDIHINAYLVCYDKVYSF